jgi:tRNA threonylcarbamoyladenosine biosynthesis protein TsaE
MELISRSLEETISAGYEFAKNLRERDNVGLFGNLGSGKTQFVKGVCRFFNVSDIVNSPTFMIVNEYNGIDDKTGNPIVINHFDLYRVKDLIEFKEIGIDSYLNGNSICIFEWGELADEYLKGNIRKVFFEYGQSESERLIIY